MVDQVEVSVKEEFHCPLEKEALILPLDHILIMVLGNQGVWSLLP